MTNRTDFLEFKKVLALLINSGFLLSNQGITNLKNSSFFDIYYSIMNVKEFIRNVEQIKSNPQNKIFIYIENRYLKSLASLLLNELSFAKDVISIINLSRNIDNVAETTNLLVILGTVNKRFYLETLRNKVNLIHIININKSHPITGNYIMYNNISDITKLVFLFALIDELFSTSVNNKVKN